MRVLLVPNTQITALRPVPSFFMARALSSCPFLDSQLVKALIMLILYAQAR